MKVLSTLKSDDDNITISQTDFDSLFVSIEAQIHFLQSEYANLIVRVTFDKDTCIKALSAV